MLKVFNNKKYVVIVVCLITMLFLVGCTEYFVGKAGEYSKGPEGSSAEREYSSDEVLAKMDCINDQYRVNRDNQVQVCLRGVWIDVECTVEESVLGDDWSTNLDDYFFYEDCEDTPNEGWDEVEDITITTSLAKDDSASCMFGGESAMIFLGGPDHKGGHYSADYPKSRLHNYAGLQDDDVGMCFGAWFYFNDSLESTFMMDSPSIPFLRWGDGVLTRPNPTGNWLAYPYPAVDTGVPYEKYVWHFNYFCQPSTNLWDMRLDDLLLRLASNGERDYIYISGKYYNIDGIRGWIGNSIEDMPKSKEEQRLENEKLPGSPSESESYQEGFSSDEPLPMTGCVEGQYRVNEENQVQICLEGVWTDVVCTIIGEPESCTSDAECLPFGKKCNPTTNQCAECFTDENCPPGEICHEGMCKELSSRWQENEDTVTDLITNRIWMRDEAPSTMTWASAGPYCESLEFAGYTDWRLPNINELRSLVSGCSGSEEGGTCPVQDSSCLDYTCYDAESCPNCGMLEGPGEDGCYWDPGIWNGDCYWYWSSSDQLGRSPPEWWDLDFRRGVITGSISGHSDWHVRCVRN